MTGVLAVRLTSNTAPNCNYVGPYANLQGCWLVGRNFNGLDLTGANLNGANVIYATFTGTRLSGVTMTGTVISSITSGGITGTPAGVTFGAVDLTGVSMYGDYYTNADLIAVTSTSGATFDFSTWSNTICPDGSNSSTYSPETCIGHGI